MLDRAALPHGVRACPSRVGGYKLLAVVCPPKASGSILECGQSPHFERYGYEPTNTGERCNWLRRGRRTPRSGWLIQNCSHVNDRGLQSDLSEPGGRSDDGSTVRREHDQATSHSRKRQSSARSATAWNGYRTWSSSPRMSSPITLSGSARCSRCWAIRWARCEGPNAVHDFSGFGQCRLAF